MITNLEQYFENDYPFYLNKINFVRLAQEPTEEEIALNCQDSISTTVNDKGVTLLVTRKLCCDPNILFELEVSFGAELTFKQERKEEVDWKNIELADEFKRNGGILLQNMMSRISLLIGQITGSFGQMPLITPPGIPNE